MHKSAIHVHMALTFANFSWFRDVSRMVWGWFMLIVGHNLLRLIVGRSLLMAVRILLVPACNLSMMVCSLPMLV